MIEEYKILQNPITKRNIRLPFLRNPPRDMNEVDFANMFIQTPQKSTKLVIPRLKATEKTSHTRSTIFNIQNDSFLEEKIQLDALRANNSQLKGQQQQIQHNKSTRLRQQFEREEQQREVVAKEMKKFKPQNSSLAMNSLQKQRDNLISNRDYDKRYMKLFTKDLDRIGNAKAFKTKKRSIENLMNPILKLKHFRSLGNNSSQQINKLGKIITEYDSEIKYFSQLKQRRMQLQQKLIKDFTQIQQKYDEDCFQKTRHYQLEEESSEQQRKKFKKELDDLSIKCQAISRSIKKK